MFGVRLAAQPSGSVTVTCTAGTGDAESGPETGPSRTGRSIVGSCAKLQHLRWLARTAPRAIRVVALFGRVVHDKPRAALAASPSVVAGGARLIADELADEAHPAFLAPTRV